MKIRGRHAHVGALGAALVLLAAGAAGAAVVANVYVDDSGAYQGCVGTAGALRVLQPGQTCNTDETGITWDRTGPVGPDGPAGPAGPPGVDGLDGLDGRDGAAGLMGPAGTPGATGLTGAQGLPGAAGPPGPPGPQGERGEPGRVAPPRAFADKAAGIGVPVDGRTLASIDLPAGRWLLTATVDLDAVGTTEGDATCRLNGSDLNATHVDEGWASLTVEAVVQRVQPFTASFSCTGSTGINSHRGKLIAVEVS